MDKEFNTTFIPKQAPLPSQVHKINRPVGILSVIAGVLFFAAIFSLIGVYVWENITINEIGVTQGRIENARAELDNEFITELKTVDNRLKIGAHLLSKHTTVSPFISLLEDSTLPSLEYVSMSYTLDEGIPTVSLQGQALTFQNIAQQAEVFNTIALFQQHFFDGFSLDDVGRVNFGLSIELDPELLKFSETISSTSARQFNVGAETP
ncbi:MAG: hypothetical protein ACI83D_000135 [Planctomycetota bacterium]|jgi:hypothetical protein